MSRPAQIISLAFMGAFAGGCLVAAVVVAPSWRRMDPEAFLDRFPEDGPRLGATLFPLEVFGALFAVLAFVGALRRGSNGRLPWGLSALCIVATLALLPVYFAGANSRMLDGAIEASEVAAELERWAGWQWLRTALAVLAGAFGAWGPRRERTL